MLAMIPTASAYSVVPLLDQETEHAGAKFIESEERASQSKWGRGVEVEIKVDDSCNRQDDHAIGSWVGMYTFDDSTGLAETWHQTGWSQNEGDTGCGQARVFYIACQLADCDPNEPDKYFIAWHPDTFDVPADGLPGHFMMVLQSTTGSNPDFADCFIGIDISLAVDATNPVLCPITMTPTQFVDNMCAGIRYYVASEIARNRAAMAECVEAANRNKNSDLHFVADLSDECAALDDYQSVALARSCQAVAAANSVLAGEVTECPTSAPLSDEAWDVPICIQTAEPQQTSGVPADVCTIAVYFNKVEWNPALPFPVDCLAAARTHVAYEAAPQPPPLDPNHVGPGSSDKAAMFTSWRYVGYDGTGDLIDKADMTWSLLTPITNCPPYEGRYKSASNLVNWAEVGPNQPSGNWCGTEVTGTPGPGFALVAVGVLATMAIIQRNRAKK